VTAKQVATTGTSRFDSPAAGHWVETTSMPKGVAYLQLASLGDGRVIAAGGVAEDNPEDNFAVTIYDPRTKSWAHTTRRPREVGIVYLALVGLGGDGRALACGGVGVPVESSMATAWTHIFDARSATWTRTTNMTTARLDHAAATSI
jgi:hypothetical protein